MRRRPLTLAAPLALALALPAAGDETRELGAHEHGRGALRIAAQGGGIAMELEAPGADIAGFEHAARSEEDRAALAEAREILSRPLDLVAFPEAAGCEAVSAEVELIAGGGHGGEAHAEHGEARDADHGEPHGDHHDEDHGERRGDEHAEAHGDDHRDDHGDDHGGEHGDGHGEEHGDDHGDDHADHDAAHGGHSEFHALWRLSCADPSAIDALAFPYFEVFPNARTLQVEIVSDRGARRFEAGREASRLDLDGAL